MYNIYIPQLCNIIKHRNICKLTNHCFYGPNLIIIGPLAGAKPDFDNNWKKENLLKWQLTLIKSSIKTKFMLNAYRSKKISQN